MKRKFVVLKSFWDDWNDFGLTDENLSLLESELIENPECGDLIKGSGGVRKVRWGLKNKGKSGGIRVFYLDLENSMTIFFLAVISKNEKENLTKTEIQVLSELVKKLKKGF